MKIIAVSNNDIALVAWSFDKKLAGCVGFAVYRIDMNAGTEAPLPALAGFKNDPGAGKPGHTTEQGPVQKFHWKDLFAKRGGLYKYKVVPLQGSPGSLQPMPGVAPLISNPVQLSPNRGVISSYFNRGILATQATARALTGGKGGKPSKGVLLQRIAQPNDPLRKSLAGDMITALKCLLDRARQQGGTCYGALYELTDPELMQALLGAPFVHLVLSNAGDGPDGDSENAPARTALRESNVDVVDRLMPAGHIGHNKFMVYADAAGKPAAVLLGSTNWTQNGLCAQTNNTLVIESPALAAEYLDYWQRLRADSEAASGDPKKLQGAKFRSDNNRVRPVRLEDNSAEIDLWLSPNTSFTSKTSSTPSPADMAEVFDLISKAQQAVIFLVFQPGTPSIVNAAAKAQNANPQLFVRGAVTDPKAVGEFNTDLFHQDSKQPDQVVPATGIEDQFGVWEAELNQAGHAIIHDKIMVLDPFSENCVVITGSHNQGWRASSNNDENLVIVKGHRGLAEAYATHVLDVYDHYRWRFLIQKKGAQGAFQSLDASDRWQDKYFDAQGRLDNPELKLWLSADPNAQARRNDAGLGSTRTPVRPPAGPQTPGGEPAPPAKKPAARKAPVKKTAAKKAAAKKPPARKTVARGTKKR